MSRSDQHMCLSWSYVHLYCVHTGDPSERDRELRLFTGPSRVVLPHRSPQESPKRHRAHPPLGQGLLGESVCPSRGVCQQLPHVRKSQVCKGMYLSDWHIPGRVSASRGTRTCHGIHVAKLMVFMTVALRLAASYLDMYVHIVSAIHTLQPE